MHSNIVSEFRGESECERERQGQKDIWRGRDGHRDIDGEKEREDMEREIKIKTC